MATAVKHKERECIMECIRLYRKLPSLWNKKSKEYRDRDEKNKAYNVIVAKYKEIFPHATKEDVIKKFNILRTNYRKEAKKHRLSLKSRSGKNNVYESKLWYYREMDFLQDQDCLLDQESASGSLTSDFEFDETETKPSISLMNSENDEDNDIASCTANTASSSCDVFHETPNNNSVRLTRQTENYENLVQERFKDESDDHHHWGLACAADLRKMEPMQQIYAKKAIAEIIMEGQLGLLHRNSVKINESPNISNFIDPLSNSTQDS